LRRSAILETNGKRRRRRPSRDGDVGGGAWWRARGTSKRQRARAILHLRFGSGAWVLAASPPLQRTLLVGSGPMFMSLSTCP
jgi:hypothetical protein